MLFMADSKDLGDENLNIDSKELIDNFKWKVAQDDRLRDIINDSSQSGMIENIKSMRSLVINFITISAGVVGLSVPLLEKSSLVVTKPLLIAGLFELMIVIIFGFYYLMSILEQENKSLVNIQRRYNEYLDEGNKARNEFYSKPTKKTYQNQVDTWKRIMEKIQENEAGNKTRPDFALNILFAAFVCGLLLMVCSLVNFEPIRDWYLAFMR